MPRKQPLHLELGLIAQAEMAEDGREAGREGRDGCHLCPAAINREGTYGTIDFSTGEAQI